MTPTEPSLLRRDAAADTTLTWLPRVCLGSACNRYPASPQEQSRVWEDPPAPLHSAFQLRCSSSNAESTRGRTALTCTAATRVTAHRSRAVARQNRGSCR